MFINKEELDKRLASSLNLNNILNPEEKESRDKKEEVEKDIDRVLEGVVINRTEINHTGIQGKTKGDENVPQIFRDIITAQAQFGAKQEDLKKNWGLSSSTISNLKNGIPNRSNPESPANKSAQAIIEKVTGRIRDKVCEKIELALDNMTPEKFENEASLKGLSSVANNLARTIQALENKKDKDTAIDNRVQTIIYAPQTSEISEYNIQEVAR